MLQKLHIQNFTLIDSIEIDFQSGFSVITGETGAGKSILLGALSLVLGKRAEASLLRDPTLKCIIEAHFKVSNYPFLKNYFKEADLDYESHCLLRRELLPTGKSRAFVNDTPVTLEVMSSIGDFLIDIHSQHQTLDIFDSQYQLHIIDGLADNHSLLRTYQDVFITYQKESDYLSGLQNNHLQALKEFDYNTYLLEELEQVQLKEGIQEELEIKQLQLENATEIIEKLGSSIALIESDPVGIFNQLQELNQKMVRLSAFGDFFALLKERLKVIQIELMDVYQELQNAKDSQEEDPDMLEQLNAQLQKIYDLQRKHQVDNTVSLSEVRVLLREKVSFVLKGTEEIEKQKEKLKSIDLKLHKMSGELHDKRVAVIPNFIDQLSLKVHQLSMPKALFKISLETQKDFTASGTDAVSFLFSANSGQSFGALKKVASGGELSRIMLSIKALLSRYVSLPTIIFDEIDTGVSGEVATKMASIMKEMGSELQLISITHLPQVASKGDFHYKVFKEDDGMQTQTQLILLNKEQRVVTLAEMLGGKELSDSAIAHAKQLLA
ncbi:MAG: DNA repair protein RecN (Recombination protein N) [Arcticibacterium sp.]